MKSALIQWFVISVILFALTRELWCWYWKINRIVAALEKLVAYSEQTSRPAPR